LTTRGRRSGLPREIEIWFVSLADRYYVIAEYPTSNWVRNIRSDPEVRVRVANEAFSGKARVLSEDSKALQRKIQALSREKYGWGEGLVVEIVPDRAE
jgi:deazaflavin-dependent oxidoreductase (nitroreductase family)